MFRGRIESFGPAIRVHFRKYCSIIACTFLEECPPPGGRDSGGLLVFAKNRIHSSLKVLKKGDNRIWFEINDALFHDIPEKIKVT